MMNLNACQVQEIISYGAKKAKKWADGKDLKTVWETCERGNWLVWILGRQICRKIEGWPTKQQLVIALCACVENVLHFIPKNQLKLTCNQKEMSREYPAEDRNEPWFSVSLRVTAAHNINIFRGWAAGTVSLEDVKKATAVAEAMDSYVHMIAIEASITEQFAASSALDAIHWVGRVILATNCRDWKDQMAEAGVHVIECAAAAAKEGKIDDKPAAQQMKVLCANVIRQNITLEWEN